MASARAGPEVVARAGTGASCVGRDAELDTVRRALAAAAAGTPGVVLVQGAAGIGKSTLLAGALVGTDAVVLAATGDEGEVDLDFGVLDQLARDAAAAAPGGRSLAAVPGTDPLAAGAVLLRAIDELALDRLVVVAVDDAHLADVASLQAITFAARRIRDAKVAVLVLRRPVGPTPVPPGLERLAQRTGGVVELGGLDVAGVAGLAATVHGQPLPLAAAERLQAHTAGHPLHTRVLLEQLTADDLLDPRELPVPRSLSALVMGQIASLSPAAADLAAALAVWGAAATLDDVAAVAEVDDALAALDDLQRAALVEVATPPGAVRVAFRHALIRASIYGDLPARRRVALHAAAARRAPNAGEVIRHRLAAATGPDAELADVVAAQARYEADHGAHRAAAQLFLNAATVTPEHGLQERRRLLGLDHLMRAGQPLGAYAADLEGCADSAMRSYVLGRRAFTDGHPSEARSLLERAWEQFADEGDPAGVLGPLAELLALVAVSTLRADDCVAWADRAAAMGGAGLPTTLLCHGYALAGDLEAAAAVADAALASSPSPAVEIDARLGRGIIAVWSNDLSRARAELGHVIGPRGDQQLLHAVNARAYLAEVCLREGDPVAAVDLAEATARLIDDARAVWLAPFARGVAASALAVQGRIERAVVHARIATEVATATGQGPGQLWAASARLWIADAQHDHRAVAVIGDQVTAAGWDSLPEGVRPWRAAYAEALIALGRLDDARDVVGRLEHSTGAGDRPVDDAAVRTQLARARGLLLAAVGEQDAAADAFDEGLALDPVAAGPLARARLELAAGARLRRAGQRTAAADLLHTAAHRLTAIGARPWLTRCDRELTACGLRPAKRTSSGPAVSLTAQERVIARIVASGRSNREVADELFISVKTVEHHLSRIYAKVGVRGRTQLAAAIAGTLAPGTSGSATAT